MPELVCPHHGPYDAAYGSCPFCAAESGQKRPAPPRPLGGGMDVEDDYAPTELQGDIYGQANDEPTDFGDAPSPPAVRPGPREPKFLDLDDDDGDDVFHISAAPAPAPVSAPPPAPASSLPPAPPTSPEMTFVDGVRAPVQADDGPFGYLIIKEGTRRGMIFTVRDGSIISRNENDIAIGDPRASNPHARMKFENGRFEIWDFASRNGTFVNGERIKAATPLVENDEITIGRTVFVFKVLA